MKSASFKRHPGTHLEIEVRCVVFRWFRERFFLVFLGLSFRERCFLFLGLDSEDTGTYYGLGLGLGSGL